MIEIHEWKCEVCGRCFEDEEDCRNHEWEHHLAEIENNITIYNFAGAPVKLTLANLDNVSYISWTSNTAIMKFLEFYEEVYGFYSRNLFPFGIEDQESGRVFYDSRSDCWVSVEERQKELEALLAIFNQSP